jgi:outer membrane protein OmpA-like peptidoglycan-associated protein
MRTLLAILLIGAAALPAIAGPDFTTRTPRPQALAASSGTSAIDPLDDVVFEHDSAVLLDSGRAQVDAAARWLRHNPRQHVVLEGYADNLGYAIYNEDLATRRAQAVRAALIARGVHADRVVVVVFGESAARFDADPLDRRVVLYATRLAPQTIVRASLDRKQALTAVWTRGKAIYVESRTRTPPEIVAGR